MEFRFKQIHGPLVGIVVSKTDRGMATRETMEPAAFLLQQERLNNKTRQLPVTIENGVISIDTGNCLNHSQRLGPLSSSDPLSSSQPGQALLGQDQIRSSHIKVLYNWGGGPPPF